MPQRRSGGRCGRPCGRRSRRSGRSSRLRSGPPYGQQKRPAKSRTVSASPCPGTITIHASRHCFLRWQTMPVSQLPPRARYWWRQSQTVLSACQLCHATWAWQTCVLYFGCRRSQFPSLLDQVEPLLATPLAQATRSARDQPKIRNGSRLRLGHPARSFAVEANDLEVCCLHSATYAHILNRPVF